MKKQKLLLAALVLLIAAASAASLRVSAAHDDGERAMLHLKSGRS
jgi:hypothetical protein